MPNISQKQMLKKGIQHLKLQKVLFMYEKDCKEMY